VWLAAGWGAWTLRRGPARTAVRFSLLLALVYAAVYWVFVDWMPGMRDAPAVGQLAAGIAGSGSARARTLRVAVVMFAFLVASRFTVAVLYHDSQSSNESVQQSSRAIGEWLRHNVPTDLVLFTSDVGALPYFSRPNTIDINPRSLTDREIALNGWSVDDFFDRDIDVVVFVGYSHDHPRFYVELQQGFDDPRFAARYRHIGVTRHSWYVDRCYWTFLSRDVPLSEPALASFPRGLSIG
jgi:hypothetical protein